jgi:hypothetical protein
MKYDFYFLTFDIILLDFYVTSFQDFSLKKIMRVAFLTELLRTV